MIRFIAGEWLFTIKTYTPFLTLCVWVCVYLPAAKSQSSLALRTRDTDHRPYYYYTHTHTHTHIRLDRYIHTFPFALMRVWHKTHQSQSVCARFRAFLSVLIGWSFRTLEELLASPFCYTLLNKNNCEMSSPFPSELNLYRPGSEICATEILCYTSKLKLCPCLAWELLVQMSTSNSQQAPPPPPPLKLWWLAS